MSTPGNSKTAFAVPGGVLALLGLLWAFGAPDEPVAPAGLQPGIAATLDPSSAEAPAPLAAELEQQSGLQRLTGTERATKVARLEREAGATVKGRATLAGKGLARVVLILTPSDTSNTPLGLYREYKNDKLRRASDLSPANEGVRGNPDASKPEPPGVIVGSTGTGKDGQFRMRGLPEGTYTLVAVHPGWTKGTSKNSAEAVRASAVELKVELVAGEVLNVGVLKLFPGRESEFGLRRSQATGGTLRVETGQPGYWVRLVREGKHLPTEPINRRGDARTLADGIATLTWKGARAIRIDLLDRARHVVGSTDQFLHYPLEQETTVSLTANTGVLTVHLPEGQGVQSDESVQFVLTRLGTSSQSPAINSIRGIQPNSKRNGVSTTAQAITYSVLRCGRYSIQATRKRVPAEGGRPVPIGSRLVGEVLVEANITTDGYVE